MPIQAHIHQFHNYAFECLYRRNLLYNTCWEDPAIDHQALDLAAHDEILVITSAGCNALDYCLGPVAPRRVIAVDANPRQSALLELKCAGIRTLSHTDFFALFGHGRHPAARRLYHHHLRPLLSPPSRRIWDERITWFSDDRPGHSFYNHGLSGVVGRSMRHWLRSRPQLWRAIQDLLQARTMAEQQRIWDQHIERRLFSPGLRWLLGRQALMSLLGVPVEQTRQVRDGHASGIAGFIRDAMRGVFRDLPITDNYFWTLYLRGCYNPGNCPRYLSAAGFQALKDGLVERLDIRTATVSTALRDDPQLRPSRFILLDHMDWMGHAQPQALAEEWSQIMRAAAPQTRLLWRSGAGETPFVDRCRYHLEDGRQGLVGERLHYHRDRADRLHRQDRVGTYASFHIADLLD